MPALVAALLVAAGTAEQRAIEHLSREVPAWFGQNKCYSCHNNGDGARALFAARRAGFEVPAAATEDTARWLLAPAKWESNHGDPGFSDKKLSRLQFSAALLEVPGNGPALKDAAALIAADQLADGSWPGDTGTPAGSPVTYNAALATHTARKILFAAGGFDAAVGKAETWLNGQKPDDTPGAAALVLALSRKDATAWLEANQNPDGGWGPFPKTPSEAFDMALAMLALKRRGQGGRVARGRQFLLRTQRENGGWPETTRPSGGSSYAQHISTTGWVLTALLETARQD